MGFACLFLLWYVATVAGGHRCLMFCCLLKASNNISLKSLGSKFPHIDFEVAVPKHFFFSFGESVESRFWLSEMVWCKLFTIMWFLYTHTLYQGVCYLWCSYSMIIVILMILIRFLVAHHELAFNANVMILPSEHFYTISNLWWYL